ncbi:MAG TPA: LacI family DNA-binding transcriptional regulator [Mucilaginibacter sp.]|jgi:LacI family transcriptional regulator|nr:LacI family DNA-binding transcriptional regulator [Mucilaginibacter sp.]
MNSVQNNTTIKTLAEKLGLSKGTVSKALKDSHEISIATKNKVIEAANELNYKPNHFASGLKSRKSKTIAVIVPEIVDSFFSLAINGIEAATQKKGYHINVYITHDLICKEKEIIKVLSDGRVDGVLISICREASDNDHIKELIDRGMPLVFFDRVADDLEGGKVVTDDFQGGYIAARHLIEQGCKKVYFLSISESLSILQKRMEGFIQAMLENNIIAPQKNVLQISTEETKSLEAIKSLLSNPEERPDGIVISVELLTIPIYNACRELNINIPDDLKIICFSNLLYASLLSPSLSTITQPAFEIGQQAASLICNSIERDTIIKKERIICPSRLDIRRSSFAESL